MPFDLLNPLWQFLDLDLVEPLIDGIDLTRKPLLNAIDCLVEAFNLAFETVDAVCKPLLHTLHVVEQHLGCDILVFDQLKPFLGFGENHPAC